MTKTREVIQHTISYVYGKTVDLGAGNAKYKSIIKAHTSEYITFDMVPGPHIDVVGDILNLPFESNTFDTVVSTQVLEHVTKPWVMVSEINRILKRDGIIILSAPFMIPYHADPHDYFRYTKEGMTGLFKDAGFNVLECESYGGLFTVFSEMIHFTLLNPYEGKSSKPIQVRIIRIIERMAAFLDRIFPVKIIYPNVYIVAKKK